MPTPLTLWTFAGRHAVEAIEDALQVFLLDSDAVVGEGDDELFPLVEGRNNEFNRHFGTAVFERIVQKVVHQVGEVHTIRVDDGIFGIDVRLDASVGIILLDFELEGHGGFFHDRVGFQLVEFEVDGVDAVEHRELQDLFGQHAESFRFREEYAVVVSDFIGR